MDNFINEVMEVMREKLGDDYELTAQNIQKNNIGTAHGISIIEIGKSVAPTLYVDPYYEMYENGTKSVNEIADIIIDNYDHVEYKGELDDISSKITDTSWLKKNIVIKLVNRDKNKRMLEDVPHIDFLDMSVIFQAVLDSSDGVCSFRITNNIMNQYGLPLVDELYDIALRNAVRIFPVKVNSLMNIISEMMSESNAVPPYSEDDDFCKMTVLTNTKGVNGAAVMLYPGVLKGVADRFESNLVILPSSIHEFIAVPDMSDGKGDVDTFISMVKEVNATQVQADEILADNAYMYDRKKDRIYNLEKYISEKRYAYNA